MRAPWSREELQQTDADPDPNAPVFLQLADDGRLSVEPAPDRSRERRIDEGPNPSS